MTDAEREEHKKRMEWYINLPTAKTLEDVRKFQREGKPFAMSLPLCRKLAEMGITEEELSQASCRRSRRDF